MKYIFLGLLLFSSLAFSADGTVNLSWDTPTAREDGTTLPIDELAGFELVYKASGSSVFTTIIIADETVTTKSLTIPLGDYEFMIAAYDTDGIYADFSDPVLHTVVADRSKPGGTGLTVEQGGVLGRLLSDIYDECNGDPLCTVEFSVQF